MAMVAGALSRRLEKLDHYMHGGKYPDPSSHHILQANRIVMLASPLLIAAVAVCYRTDQIPHPHISRKCGEHNNYHPCRQNNP